MLKILDDWIDDLPWQFQNQKRIEILLKAFAKQMQEVADMFVDLYELTDIDLAVGKNLDFVGTIIPLSRAEAGEYIGMNAGIDDETYRRVLRSKLARNVNNCTYYDLQETLLQLGSQGKFTYQENANNPATIIFEAAAKNLGTDDRWIFYYPLDKAAGVQIKLKQDISVDTTTLKVGLNLRTRKAVNIFPADLTQNVTYTDWHVGTAMTIVEEWELRGE